MEKIEDICRDCIHSKQAEAPFPTSPSHRAPRVLELYRGDPCRPIDPKPLEVSAI